MPVEVSVSPDERLGVVRLTGSVTAEDVATAALHVIQHPDWDPAYRVIWDGSGIKELIVEIEPFEALLVQERLLREAGEEGELVFVLTDDLWAGFVTLFQRKMRGAARPMTVVATLAEARAHLGLTPE